MCILEVAILSVKQELLPLFEASFAQAVPFIATIKGYQGHTLNKCCEKPNQYILLVQWRTLEDHTIGFRKSDHYQEWKRLLHHYYDPFPKVEHYTLAQPLFPFNSSTSD